MHWIVVREREPVHREVESANDGVASAAMMALSAPTWALVATSALLVVGVASLLFFMTRGWLTLDLGWGRSLHPVGPIVLRIEAPRDLVFEQISSPYLGPTPQALRGKLEVLDQSERLVVAAHRTKLRRFVSVTVESVVFEPPVRVAFRHLRGPVPHAVEEFMLQQDGNGTELQYRGELGIDFWLFGRLAARFFVVPAWEEAVRGSLEHIKSQAEQRAAARARRVERRGER